MFLDSDLAVALGTHVPLQHGVIIPAMELRSSTDPFTLMGAHGSHTPRSQSVDMSKGAVMVAHPAVALPLFSLMPTASSYI